MLQKLGTYLPEHLWSRLIDGPGAFAGNAFEFANNGSESATPAEVSVLWVSAIWGDLKCANPQGIPQAFNYSTRFFSHCILSLIGLVSILTLLAPILFRIHRLRSIPAEKPTFRGQLATISAFSATFLTLCEVRAPIDVGVVSFGMMSVFLHFYQDGRVVVCSPELLVYWLFIGPVYTGWALDRSLSGESSYILWGAAVASGLAFYLEMVNPERKPIYSFDDESILSRITSGFLYPVLTKSEWVHSQLPDPPKDIDTEQCYSDLQNALEKYPKTNANRLLLSMMQFLAADALYLVVYGLTNEVLQMLRPKLLDLMLSSMRDYNNSREPLFRCYYYAMLFACYPLLTYPFSQLSNIAETRGSLKSKLSLVSMIYRKGLVLAPSARKQYNSAKLMSMISADVGFLFWIVKLIPLILTAPVVLPVIFWQLWGYLRWSMFSAAIVYLLSVPITSLVHRKLITIYRGYRLVCDQRIQLTANLFRNIKSLKLYAWELPFFERITHVRYAELSFVRLYQALIAIMSEITNSMSMYAAVVVFAVFLYMRIGVLTPEVIFPSLILLERASNLFKIYPNMLPLLSRILTSQSRINDLLMQDEQDHANYSRSATRLNGPSVEVRDASVSWDGPDNVVLTKISFAAHAGDLICIIGRVGSGKTALLEALCGELSVLQGEIKIQGTVCYCSQEPWLQNISVKDNILFGQEFCEEWYAKVIEACELKADIDNMPDGDLTEIGERGISLSGGQKARVALARAIYSRADIVLLDDVLSAVDEHVGAALIRKVLSTDGLLANRTIILATNNVKVLSQSSLVIALSDQQIVERETFSDVIRKGHANSQTYQLIEGFGHASDLKVDPNQLVHRRELVNKTGIYLPTLEELPLRVKAQNFRSEQDNEEEEDFHKGNMAFMVFKRYYGYLPAYYIWILIGTIVIASLAVNLVTVFLGYMSNQSLTTLGTAKWYFIVFAGIVTTAGVMNTLTQFWGDIAIGLQLGKMIHDKMLWNLTRAPLQFFDVTPLGRLINRFSADTEVVDETVPGTARYIMQITLNLVITVSALIIGSPMIALFALPLLWYGNRVRILYTPNRRKASRMESAANSPVLAHIEDSFKGQTTLRAYDRMGIFIAISNIRSNYWAKAAFTSKSLSFWLGFHMMIIAVALTLVTALSLSFLTSLNLISVGYAAVMNNFATRATVAVTAMIDKLAESESVGVALERSLEYVDVETEAPSHIEATEPSAQWPEYGTVKINQYSTGYKFNSPDVLKNLALSVKSGEKIGVVGRTGSGKSTLTLSLFRILESRSGSIEIDSCDISLLGLYDLRSRLSIIPQDAQIFSGTIRINLDPLEQLDDARLWEVLDLCHLKARFEMQGKNLDTELEEEGTSLSRGESQLLCLGRALLRDSKILVLDEATASVDVETDQAIQETIRSQFSNRTIITIAHRLNTIMDSDRILVLDHGEAKEFDTPENLLKRQGLFYSLHNAEKKEEESLI